MTVESFAIQQINTLITDYDKLELEIYIDDFSYSIDFWVIINGNKKQCLELIDEGVILEKKYNEVADTIAKYARTSEDYKSGCVNKYNTSSI